ncbi:endonuclease/exonuclease/phosphatase family protein [Streptomyces sp. NPDC004680]|uniref:endonuclease/exonuclease/phosphatase family protein n=1 Tax=Streptomyces sp. NPDC004680 TaxID=3154287 RepID=UPI0033BE1BCE
MLTAALIRFHQAVPNSVVHLGSLLEAFLPWFGLVIVVLLVPALLRRSATALVALLLPTAVWALLFGRLLLPGTEPGPHDLVVVQHNVSDENTDPVGTARTLAAAEPDLIALEELVPPALTEYARALAPDYPHHVIRGTVGLWSKHPLTGARPVDIKPREITEPWSRGLRATVHAPLGDIAVYVAHLPSVRVRASGLASSWRDESAGLLGKAVAAEKLKTVLLLGDLNGTVDDRGLAPLTSQMDTPQRGFAFSFPADFPIARIDQVMTRSATVRQIRTLSSTGSDHLPVAARIALP